MLDDSHRAAVLTMGFTVVAGAVDPPVAVEWRGRLAELVRADRAAVTDRTAVDDYMVHNPMVLNPIFYGVLEHPAVVAALDTFSPTPASSMPSPRRACPPAVRTTRVVSTSIAPE